MSFGRRPRGIGDALRLVREQVEPPTLLAGAQACWREAVGDRIAVEAQPVAEREGILTVACRAATWAEELDLLHDELLARLNRALPAGAVTGFRFVVAPLVP